MCKEGAKCSARKPDSAMREGQPDTVRHRTGAAMCTEHEAITRHVVDETVFIGLIVPEG